MNCIYTVCRLSTLMDALQFSSHSRTHTPTTMPHPPGAIWGSVFCSRTVTVTVSKDGS